MKILDIVKFNDRIAIVVDTVPELTYEKEWIYLIGSDESKLLFDCLYYESDRYAKAFAGREFDLPMKDGSITHCNGQYWSGRVEECAERLGIKLGDVTIQSLDELKRCYVFSGMQVNWRVYCDMLSEFFRNNPTYEIWGYMEYEMHIRNLPNVFKNDHPDKDFQEKIRKRYEVIK